MTLTVKKVRVAAMSTPSQGTPIPSFPGVFPPRC